MQNRNITITSLLILLLGCWLPPVVRADTIVLKTGKKLQVEKAWQEGDRVWFFFHGMKASLLKNEVRSIRIDAPKNRSHPQNNAGSPDPGAVPGYAPTAQAVPSAERDLPLSRDGFGMLHWGVPVSQVDGLEQVTTPGDLPGVTEYQRPADPLQFRNLTLQSVVYAFWNGQLFTITLWTRGQSNFKALRSRALAVFGPAHHRDKSPPRYLWSLQDTDVMLKYTPGDQLGMLWLRCCQVDHQYKVAHMTSQSSYLKWIHSRKQ